MMQQIMQNSSSETRPIMEGIYFHAARTLLQLIDEAPHAYESVIEKRYLDHEREFQGTLDLLQTLGFLRREGGFIRKGTKFNYGLTMARRSNEVFNRSLVEYLIASRSIYGDEIRELFKGFTIENGKPQMPPLTTTDFRYAARNTLIAAKILHVNHTTGICEIPIDSYLLYFLATKGIGQSPSELEKRLSNEKEIGREAELKVLRYEREEVGPEFANHVIHIADYNTSAGFDIASIRARDGIVSENRFIEVKAVSSIDYAFHLSANELKTAREQGNRYFLYLLPVRNGAPNLDELIIFQDPARTLIGNAEEWEISAKTLYCKRTEKHEI